MKYLAIAALLIAGPVLAQQTPTTRSSKASAADPNQQICRQINRLGSRLDRQRVCMTRAEWEEQRRTSRQGLDRMQSSRATNGN